MQETQRKEQIRHFVERWKDRGYEKGEPFEVRCAHQQNDRAVMQAYGFPVKDFTESDCVARLLEIYSELTK